MRTIEVYQVTGYQICDTKLFFGPMMLCFIYIWCALWSLVRPCVTVQLTLSCWTAFFNCHCICNISFFLQKALFKFWLDRLTTMKQQMPWLSPIHIWITGLALAFFLLEPIFQPVGSRHLRAIFSAFDRHI